LQRPFPRSLRELALSLDNGQVEGSQKLLAADPSVASSPRSQVKTVGLLSPKSQVKTVGLLVNHAEVFTGRSPHLYQWEV
jgi:hypothetical protein